MRSARWRFQLRLVGYETQSLSPSCRAECQGHIMARGIYKLNKARNTHQSVDPMMFSLVVSIDGNFSEQRNLLQLSKMEIPVTFDRV